MNAIAQIVRGLVHILSHRSKGCPDIGRYAIGQPAIIAATLKHWGRRQAAPTSSRQPITRLYNLGDQRHNPGSFAEVALVGENGATRDLEGPTGRARWPTSDRTSLRPAASACIRPSLVILWLPPRIRPAVRIVACHLFVGARFKRLIKDRAKDRDFKAIERELGL